MQVSKEQLATFLRNFVFGVEDSLVSTVGLVSGVAIAGASRSSIFLTGMVLIFVEAFSMGVGSFLSEESSETYINQGPATSRFSFVAAVIMFVSYFLSGFVPLSPYIVAKTTQQAFIASIIASVIALFALGLWGAHLSKLPLGRGGLRMMVIGGLAIGLGVTVGTLMNHFGFSAV